MEIKLCQMRMGRVRLQIGFKHGIEVGSNGLRGILCLAWKQDIEVHLRSFSTLHIDVGLHCSEKELMWRLTGFYGSLYPQHKEGAWELMRNLSHEESVPWLVCGDFDEILYSFKKVEGIPREERKMDEFRRVLEDCQLVDIGFLGAWFT